MIEFVLLMGLGLFLVVGFANLAVNGFVKGVAHSAVDQGARAGARQDVDSVPACEARVQQVLGNLSAANGATMSCSTDGEVVTAVVSLRLESWVPIMGDTDVDVTGQARKEGLR